MTSMPRPVRWARKSDPSFGLLVTDRLVINLSSESVSAYGIQTGDLLWHSESEPASGWIPSRIVDDVLVLHPEYEEAIAFVIEDGRQVDVPPNVQLPAAPERVEPGYRLAGNTLWRGDIALHQFRKGDEPAVQRFGHLTIVNNHYDGVVLLEDDARVAARLPFGDLETDALPAVVNGSVAAVAACDSMIYVLAL